MTWAGISIAEVHPRACGGNGRGDPRPMTLGGPSPRLRGKRGRGGPSPRRPRSIPAPAGETGAGPGRRGRRPVHPRACGGNHTPHRNGSSQSGPSPRLRGKPLPEIQRLVAGRSIPAPAGETGPRPVERESSGVHPRACGGNSIGAISDPISKGPSPRLRGKRTGGAAGDSRAGSIPAPAGETAPCWAPAAPWWVHPRACGGN